MSSSATSSAAAHARCTGGFDTHDLRDVKALFADLEGLGLHAARDHERCPADAEGERALPEVGAHGRRGHAVDPQGEQAPQRAAADGQERRFDDERRQDADLGESERMQRADFTAACSDERVHRVHGARPARQRSGFRAPPCAW